MRGVSHQDPNLIPDQQIGRRQGGCKAAQIASLLEQVRHAQCRRRIPVKDRHQGRGGPWRARTFGPLSQGQEDLPGQRKSSPGRFRRTGRGRYAPARQVCSEQGAGQNHEPQGVEPHEKGGQRGEGPIDHGETVDLAHVPRKDPLQEFKCKAGKCTRNKRVTPAHEGVGQQAIEQRDRNGRHQPGNDVGPCARRHCTIVAERSRNGPKIRMNRDATAG